VARRRVADRPRVAFVLGGGGGPFGAHEVGMLRALVERGIVPDLVLGTSVGAINGVAVAADPTAAGIERLHDAWCDIDRSRVFDGSVVRRLATLARTRTHLHGNASLRAMLAELLPVALIEELPVPFQCVAASIERAREHWFCAGPIVPAVVASAAVPGLLPPVRIDGEHFIDGGIVNSIPLSRAIALQAEQVFVLHVGRLDRPLEPPRSPWEVGLVAFEIARRHRFVDDLASIPGDVEVHVLETGQTDPPRYTDRSQFRYRDTTSVRERIARAHEASPRYLDEHGLGSR
jgi:NTE family protein